jgi:ubiquinone/menaquinone biosynthesis C-methylase UbiE
MIGRVEQYVIRGGREGYERLQVLARARWPDTRDLLDLVRVGPGARCLDLGCGGGDVSFELAQLVGPNGHVTGVDMDEVKLALGRASAVEKGLANVEFRAANVNDWSEAESYDLVYCRLLLEHLSRPVDLLRRMWDAVRPGGTIVVEDADFDGQFCHPPNDGFDFYARTYPRVLERNGGDAAAGRKVYGYFLEAGIPNPNLRLVQNANTTGEEKTLSLSTLEATADAILAKELASEDEVSAALASLAAFTDDPATLIGEPRIFQLWCRRPSG